MGPPPRLVVAEVGEWMTAHRHPRDRPKVQTEPDTREAHPRLRVHYPSRTLPQVVVHPVCHA